MPHEPGHILSSSEKMRRFLDERQAEPPTTPSSTDKLNEFIGRQGAAPEGLVEGGKTTDRFKGLLGGIGRRVTQPFVNIPGVTPGIQRGIDEASKPLEGFAEELFRSLSFQRPAGEPTFNPIQGLQQSTEAFRERPFLQQLGIGLLDPAVAIARAPSAAGAVTRAVPADPFLRAATPATQRIGETLGTQGTTAAVSRMRLAQTGQRAGPGVSAVPDITPRPSAVRQTFTQEGDEALLFAAGEQNRLDPTRAVREAAEPSVTQRQGGTDLTAIKPPPERAGRPSLPGSKSPNAPAAPELPVTANDPRPTPRLGDPTNFTDQLDVTFNPNAARRVGEQVAKTPVVGSVIRWANPTMAEVSQVGRAGLARAASIDEGRNRISAFTASQRQHGLQNELFGPTNEGTGLLTKGKFKGQSVQEIAENPSKFDLSEQQRRWIDAGDDIERELLDFYRRNGIDINQVPLDEIERYAGRIHVAQVTPDGEILAQASVGRGRSLGGRTSAEQPRTFTTVKEAQENGFVPLSYQESLRARSQSAWNRVINKQTQEWLIENPGAGVTIRPATIGEQGSFGSFQDLNFKGKVVEGPSAGEFVAEINNILQPQSVNSVLQGLNSLNSVQRIFALAGDASLFTIQLLATSFRHPLITGRAGVEFPQTLMQSMFNPRAARRRRARRLTEQNEVFQDMPGVITSDTGLEATEAFGKRGLLNNVVLGKPAALLRPFQQAFEATMDEAGAHLAIAMRQIAGDNPQRLRDATDYVNNMRGLTSSARIGLSGNQRLVESAVLLAPRYRRAVAALHASVIQGGLRGELARKAYLHLAVGVVSSYAGLSMALGLMEGKSEEVIKKDLRDGLDPRNNKFLLWNMGGQAVGVGSKFTSDLRMLGKIATDPTAIADLSEGSFNIGSRWVRSQLASVPSNAWDLFSGSDYLGEPITNDFSGNPLDSLKAFGELIKEDLMPIWVSSVLFEGGTPDDRATRGVGEFGGLRTYQYPDVTLDEVIKELFGKDEDFDTLPRRQRSRAIEVWEGQLSEPRRAKREKRKERKKEEEDRIEREFNERQRRR